MKKTVPVVSVIIPIYNAYRWIDRGMENILSQSLQDIEIWLVDDGSTDKSIIKCEQWTKQDERVHIIRKKNGGAGSARNAGIEAANGHYIYFFDIDDLAKPSLLEYCTSKMDDLRVDYMMFGFNMIEAEYAKNILVCDHKEYIIKSNSALRNIFVDEMVLCKGSNGFPWNKMYRRSFLNKHNLRFENQRIQQDEVFNLLVYEKLEYAYISPEVLYDYFIYNKGNTRSHFIPERFDIYISVRNHFDHLIKFWQLKDERLELYLNKRFYSDINKVLRFNMFHSECDWSKERKLEEINRVMSHPLSKKAIYNLPKEGIENKLFAKAFISRNLLHIDLLNRIFKVLRIIRHL